MFMSNIYTLASPKWVLGHSNSNIEVVMGDFIAFRVFLLETPGKVSTIEINFLQNDNHEGGRGLCW